MPFADVNGFQMHYQVRGDGPPLIIAHGLLSSMLMADILGEVPIALFQHFSVVTYDARGHGESGFTTDTVDYQWESLAADLHGLLNHLGIKQAHLGGTSMGGGTALVFALRHPEMVNRIMLQSPPPVGQQQSAPGAALFGGLALLIEGLGLNKAVETVLKLSPWADLKKTAPMMFTFLRQWLLSLNQQAVVPAIRGIAYGPALADEDFSRIQAESLLIAHPDDELHPVASAERLRDTIPNSRLVVAPDALYYNLHRDELASTIQTFLENGDA
ncbi:MAG: alpha/beta hydrolase [Dehalococcoidia bacterium]|jgi:pimeloyl-ACP methyl ester carboxylesterase